MRFALLQTCAMVILSAFGTPPTPSSVRVFLIDVSSSMQAEKIREVKQQLQEATRLIPPSADKPIVLITFDSAPREPQTFTTPDQLQDAIGKIDTGGGTDIAAAVVKAAEFLAQRLASAATTTIYLYTDGEHTGSLEELRQAKERLDDLFARRSKQGLAQAVYVETWGTGQSQLIPMLNSLQNAPVHRIDRSTFAPLRLVPSVTVEAAKRQLDPSVLDVTVRCDYSITGDPTDLTLPEVRFTCTQSSARGDTNMTIHRHRQSVTGTISLPIPPDAESLGKFHLPFRVARTTTQPPDKTTLTIPTEEISAVVQLPKLQLIGKLTASASYDKPRWSDPLHARASYDATLTITIDVPTNAYDISGSFEVVPGGATRITAGQTTVPFSTAGPHLIRLSLEGPVQSTTATPDMHAGQLQFALVSKNLPTYLRLSPSTMEFDETLPAPSQVTTTMTTHVTDVTPTVWSNPPWSAAFGAEIEIDVQGPLVDGSRIHLIVPSGVRLTDLSPRELVSGKQIVRLSAEANLPAHPASRQFEFVIAPPNAPSPAVRIVAPSPIRINVVGPPAIALANARGSEIKLSHWDDTVITWVPIQLMLRGVNHPPDPLFSAIVREPSGAARLAVTEVALYRPSQLPLQVALPESRSYWRDIRHRYQLHVEPAATLPAVLPAEISVLVVHQAPFKRHFFVGSIIVVPLLVALIVLFVVLKHRSPESSLELRLDDLIDSHATDVDVPMSTEA